MDLVVWLLAAAFAGWALVRLLGLERGFPLVAGVAFTPYVAAVSPLPVGLAALAGQWWAAGLAGAAALGLGAVVLPRAVPGRPAPGGGPALRVLTINLYHGEAEPDRIVALVRDLDADLLALQEHTELAAKKLAAAGLAELLPHRVEHFQPNRDGSALHARYPLTDPGVRTRPTGSAQVHATLHPPGLAPVRVESAHPSAPYARRRVPAWWADLAAQPAADPAGVPRILLGDLNSTLDHAPLRRLLRTGYRDAAATVGAGLAVTWRDRYRRLLPGVTLDHVLADRRIGVRRVEVHRVAGTDHRAVLAELAPPPVPAPGD
jgi:endonuclease/exonuclease/phosphatase (EEP) superfamily protein YafD